MTITAKRVERQLKAHYEELQKIVDEATAIGAEAKINNFATQRADAEGAFAALSTAMESLSLE